MYVQSYAYEASLLALPLKLVTFQLLFDSAIMDGVAQTSSLESISTGLASGAKMEHLNNVRSNEHCTIVSP